jgi:hypothetical protein
VSEVETGRADAGRGLFLKGKGDGNFKPYFFHDTGLNIYGDVKDIQLIKTGTPGERLILVTNNNEAMQVLKWTGVKGQSLSVAEPKTPKQSR